MSRPLQCLVHALYVVCLRTAQPLILVKHMQLCRICLGHELANGDRPWLWCSAFISCFHFEIERQTFTTSPAAARSCGISTQALSQQSQARAQWRMTYQRGWRRCLMQQHSFSTHTALLLTSWSVRIKRPCQDTLITSRSLRAAVAGQAATLSAVRTPHLSIIDHVKMDQSDPPGPEQPRGS